MKLKLELEQGGNTEEIKETYFSMINKYKDMRHYNAKLDRAKKTQFQYDFKKIETQIDQVSQKNQFFDNYISNGNFSFLFWSCYVSFWISYWIYLFVDILVSNGQIT